MADRFFAKTCATNLTSRGSQCLLNSASGEDKDGNALLLPEDLSAYLGKRCADARATNPLDVWKF